MSTAAAEWTYRYEGRARCPDGHEFTATWYDTTRAAQTCPVCGTVFRATWKGFTFKPETVIASPPGQEPGHDPR